MKLLVPKTSAGMVIGKGGARIKEIREHTGAHIQVFPKAPSPEAKVSLERVITIAAESNEVLVNGIQRVLEKVAADPQHASTIDHKDESFGSTLHAHTGQTATVQPFDFTGRQSGGIQFGSMSSMQQTQFGGQVSSTPQVWQPNQQRTLGKKSCDVFTYLFSFFFVFLFLVTGRFQALKPSFILHFRLSVVDCALFFRHLPFFRFFASIYGPNFLVPLFDFL